MKKIALVAALALMAGVVFAQAPGMGPGMMVGKGAGGPAAIDWKLGTVVTSEYKKVSGQLSTSQTLWGNAMTLKADGTEYQIFLPRIADLSTLKAGDTITVEGVFTTVKADTKVTPTVHPFKVTVAGKEVDLTDDIGGGRGMMDNRGHQGMGRR